MLTTTKNRYVYKPSRLDKIKTQHILAEVETFNAKYCAVLDGGLVEQWPDFFTSDAIYRITARENADLDLPVGLVYVEGCDMIRDRATAIAHTQMYAPRYLLHIVTNTRIIDENDKGEIEAEANFLLIQTLIESPSTMHLAGRYYDTFVRSSDGTLLLRERQVIYDTTLLANDLVYPV
ncbi:MAG: ring-hydroxylating dioxygenase subunit beta [Burkholderiaceae bacterium]|nr:MAG: ring-hydroxylating dioxygenase subunit beta [Burkholderiaceae bacterium]